MILTARGPEQQAQGVNNTLAYINLALALGSVGKPFSGYGTLTGQGNGQGGREHGQKADQLPGYRRIDDPAARQHVAASGACRRRRFPGRASRPYELLDAIGARRRRPRAVRHGLEPRRLGARRARRSKRACKALDLLVVCDFFLSETAQLADVVLPSAQWAEEDGTMTNLEGRVILRRRAIDAARRRAHRSRHARQRWPRRSASGASFRPAAAARVFDELRRATRGGPADYSGITYERIEAEDGVFWPCPAPDHPGTPRLFADRFPDAERPRALSRRRRTAAGRRARRRLPAVS